MFCISSSSLSCRSRTRSSSASFSLVIRNISWSSWAFTLLESWYSCNLFSSSIACSNFVTSRHRSSYVCTAAAFAPRFTPGLTLLFILSAEELITLCWLSVTLSSAAACMELTLSANKLPCLTKYGLDVRSMTGSADSTKLGYSTCPNRLSRSGRPGWAGTSTLEHVVYIGYVINQSSYPPSRISGVNL